MNRGGFSWKRFLGISAAKARFSRSIGIPLTKSGRQRKLGAITEKIIIASLALLIGGIYSLLCTIKNMLNLG
jgi:hypothetical protein